MERAMTVEERIRKAEEIYARRQGSTQKKTATVTVNSNNNKDIKLLKKMVIQIFISLLMYLIFYTVQNSNYIFSEDFLNKANELLSYDINFSELYQDLKQNFEQGIVNIKKQEESNNTENKVENNMDNNVENNTENGVIDNNAIGGAEQEKNVDSEQTETQLAQEKPLTEEEQDIINIKATTTFVKPVEGIVSSKFGQREPTTSTVPKNHTGVDIAANMGTKIKSATDGEVVISSEEGDYGKHLKIQIGEVSIIYAHCNNLYVKQGDRVVQGQEIAEVGSTGNSTGPHLHFEIRISERIRDPQKILEL